MGNVESQPMRAVIRNDDPLPEGVVDAVCELLWRRDNPLALDGGWAAVRAQAARGVYILTRYIDLAHEVIAVVEAHNAAANVPLGAVTPQRSFLLLTVMQDFHQRYPPAPIGQELPPRHNGAWSDSLALTHCLCFGGAGQMLDHLLANPDDFERLYLLTHWPDDESRQGDRHLPKPPGNTRGPES